MKQFTAVLLVLFPLVALAEPQAARTITQKNSPCSIVISGGEYPTYQVMKGKKVLFAPESDGIVSAVISRFGKYVALSAGETELIDVEKGKKSFGIAIVNCLSGKVAGYYEGKPTLIKKWNGDSELVLAERVLKFHEPSRLRLP